MSDSYFVKFFVHIEGEQAPAERIADILADVAVDPRTPEELWATMVALASKYITAMESGWPTSASDNRFAQYAEQAYMLVCEHLGRPPYLCGDDEAAWK